MTNLYILFAVTAGAGVAAQAVINSRLRLFLGAPVWAACTQFIVGLVVLVLLAAVTRQPLPSGGGMARTPWWMWTGGLYGAAFIFMSVVATPRLGAALMLSASIVGQLGAALVIDHYGVFGAEIIPITTMRIVGVILLIVGVVLIRGI